MTEVAPLMSETRINAGTRLLFTSIPHDFSERARSAIETACSQFSQISNAFLVRCSIPSELQIRLVLVIVVSHPSDGAMIASKLIEMLGDVTLDGRLVDILPVERHSIPPAVLQAGTQIK